MQNWTNILQYNYRYVWCVIVFDFAICFRDFPFRIFHGFQLFCFSLTVLKVHVVFHPWSLVEFVFLNLYSLISVVFVDCCCLKSGFFLVMVLSTFIWLIVIEFCLGIFIPHSNYKGQCFNSPWYLFMIISEFKTFLLSNA